MAAIRAVTLKLLFTFIVTLCVKKPLFTSANSCCYSFHGENVVDHVNLHFTSSFWQYYREKGISLNPNLSLRILLILSGDIEVCPGPRARCTKCEKCFRRNTDQRSCINCHLKHHERCLSLVSGVLTCETCLLLEKNNQNEIPTQRWLPELFDLCKLPGLKLLHQNIRGLFGKKDELQNIILNHNIDIFGVTELFLTEDIPSNFVKIPGYTFVRKNRKSGIGGGTGIYIKDNIPFVRRIDLEHEFCEAVWIEICYPHTKSFIVGIIYKPPDSSKHLSECFNDILSNSLSIIDAENKEVIILGDINCDYLVKNDHRFIKEIFTINGYKQLINKPTRITETTETLIDVIQTTHPINISKSVVIPAGLSDHDMIGCVRKMYKFKRNPKTITCRNYAKYNPETINKELVNNDWENVYNSVDANIAWQHMNSLLTKTIDQHAPFISKRVKNKPSPWLSIDIKKQMNLRNQLMRKARKTGCELDISKYKQKRNYVKNAISRAKHTHYNTILKENASKPEKFWKTVKEVFPTKSKGDQQPSSFIINGSKTTDKKVIVNGFCKFLSTVASKLKSVAFPLTDCVWGHKLLKTSSKIIPSKCFRFTPVSSIEILSYLQKLKRNKAVGIDNLPPGFLKDVAFIIAKPLTHVINLSLMTGTVPTDFKNAKVTPLFKSGATDKLDNYRPISVLSTISKILEKCVHTQVMKYLEVNNLLSIYQFGFRKNRSTELAATTFIDQVRKGMDNGKYTGAIYIDLSKAFDTISHATILNKLPEFGIVGTPYDWFSSYLFCRYQSVAMNNVVSDSEPIYCGVPQGSILGPLLFLLHFNNSAKTLVHCNIVKYADDTVLFISHQDIDVVEKLLNKDFCNICRWLEENELIINPKKGKTEFMVFGTNIRLSWLNNPPMEIQYNNTTINFTTSYKYLGLLVNDTLNMSEHIAMTLKKASSRVHLLRRIRFFIDSNTAATIYKSMIVPLLTYCPLVTSCMTNTLNLNLERLEIRAARIISADITTRIPKVSNIHRKRCCTFVYRCLQQDVCENFINYFEVVSGRIKTRNQGLLIRLPKIKLEVARKGFYFMGAKYFNELPYNIRNADTLSVFKDRLNKYLL